MLFTDFELSKVIQMINIEFKTQPTPQTIMQKYFCAKWLSVENLRFLSCRMPKLYILKGSDKFLPPATKLGQGNIFRSVCQEFCSQGGVCTIACWDTPPPGPEADPPQEQRQTPPDQRQTPPPGADPPAQCMLGDTGNKRAVRILLECILVSTNNHVGQWVGSVLRVPHSTLL